MVYSKTFTFFVQLHGFRVLQDLFRHFWILSKLQGFRFQKLLHFLSIVEFRWLQGIFWNLSILQNFRGYSVYLETFVIYRVQVCTGFLDTFEYFLKTGFQGFTGFTWNVCIFPNYRVWGFTWFIRKVF